MWFKNLYLFKFENAFSMNAEELHDELSAKLFSNCTDTQRQSMGWGFPMGKGTTSTTHSVNGNILLTMIRQERLLPSSVIKEVLHEKIDEIEEKEGRKVSSREKKEIKEDVEHELLPRAFTRTVTLDAWIDRNGEWLIVNTSSAARAEDFVKLLRKTLGSLPVSLPESETAPAVAMTEWLQSGKTPEPFVLGYECGLKNQGDDKGAVNYKKHDLGLDEVQGNLKSGKFVSELALEWDEKISFVLTENLVIKKLKFLDVLEEQLNDNDPQTHAEHRDIEFSLMAGEIELLLNNLFTVLGNDVVIVEKTSSVAPTEEYTPTALSEEIDLDPLYSEALEIVVETQRASIAYLQRRLKVGYNRAARLIDSLEETGVVSPVQSDGGRVVLKTMEQL